MIHSVEPSGSIHTLGFSKVAFTLLKALVCGRCCCLMRGQVGQVTRSGAEVLKQQAQNAVEEVAHVFEERAETMAHSSKHLPSSASLGSSGTFGPSKQLATSKTFQPALKREKHRYGLEITVVAVRDLPNMETTVAGCDPFFRITVISKDNRDAKKTLRTSERSATKNAVKPLKSSSTLSPNVPTVVQHKGKVTTSPAGQSPGLNVPSINHIIVDDLESPYEPLPDPAGEDHVKNLTPVQLLTNVSGSETVEKDSNKVLAFEDNLEQDNEKERFSARWDEPLVPEEEIGILQKMTAWVCCCRRCGKQGSDEKNHSTVVPFQDSLRELKYVVGEQKEETETGRSSGEQLQWDLLAYELVGALPVHTPLPGNGFSLHSRIELKTVRLFSFVRVCVIAWCSATRARPLLRF